MTEAEQLYLSRHEENLNKYGLAHNREGKIIRSSELSGERSSNQPNPMLRKQKEVDHRPRSGGSGKGYFQNDLRGKGRRNDCPHPAGEEGACPDGILAKQRAAERRKENAA